MKFPITLCLLGLLISVGLQAQPTIEWQKAYGGTGIDNIADIHQTSDGGYILGGNTNSKDGDVVSPAHDSSEAWIVKLDNTGAVSWQKTFGGTLIDACASIIKTSDGGYIFCGSTNSTDGDITNYKGGLYDAWVVKLSATGAVEWKNTYGGTNADFADYIQQTADGGYIFIGRTSSSDGDVASNKGGQDIWVVKLTATGAITWEKTYGGTSSDYCYSIQQTKDGGYIAGGGTFSTDGDITNPKGGVDCWVLKLTSTGTISWQKTYGGSNADRGFYLEESTYGGYIMVGNTLSNDSDVNGLKGMEDIWVVKTDTMGTIEWQKPIGGSAFDFSAYNITQGTDGNYLIGAATKSNDGDVSGLHGTEYDIWAVNMYPDGSFRWKLALGGTKIDYGKKIRQTADGGYILAGTTNSSDGDATNNGYHGSGTDLDIWIVKLGSTAGIDKQAFFSEVQVYPNPVTDNLTISGMEKGTAIQITDIAGAALLKTVAAETEINIDISAFAPGAYLLQLTGENGEKFSKTVIKH